MPGVELTPPANSVLVSGLVGTPQEKTKKENSANKKNCFIEKPPPGDENSPETIALSCSFSSVNTLNKGEHQAQRKDKTNKRWRDAKHKNRGARKRYRKGNRSTGF